MLADSITDFVSNNGTVLIWIGIGVAVVIVIMFAEALAHRASGAKERPAVHPPPTVIKSGCCALPSVMVLSAALAACVALVR